MHFLTGNSSDLYLIILFYSYSTFLQRLQFPQLLKLSKYYLLMHKYIRTFKINKIPPFPSLSQSKMSKMELTIAYRAALAIISTFTLLGNIVVVILFIKRRDWLKTSHSCLLLALAIQDLMTAINLLLLPGFVLPTDVYDIPTSTKLREFYCCFIWSWYFPFALSIVSVYTCLMLAIDRWLAVWKSIIYKRFRCSAKFVALMLIIPWIAGFGFEIGTVLKAESSRKNNASYICNFVEVRTSPENTMKVIILFIGKGVLPAMLISITYGTMMNALKKSASRVSSNKSHSSKDQVKSSLALKKVTRMVCLASASVIFCWLPDQIYYFLYELNLIELSDTVHNVLHILGFLNTCFNPIIYNFYNNHYNKEFRNILSCCFRRNTQIHSIDTVNN